ncbi:MAG: CPBP family intramembrane metalloprotease [Bacteroidetes bacterium]|nr:CPBP family intramembrane metalloprotease [Bacteroidota bacterium]
MLIKEPLLYRTSPTLKLLSVLLIILLSLLFTLIISIVIGFLFYGGDMMDYLSESLSFSDPELLPMLKYLQIVNTLGLFVFPPLIFAYMVSRKPWQYLNLHRNPAFVSTLTAIAAIVVILPFLHWVADINEMMLLPEWMSGIENWMKRSEEQAKELTDLFLGTSSIAGLMVNMLMIAILPAIGEELLFRAVLLRLFRELTKNVHLAVIISAILFSALHMQFYGFLPRFILGLFLGYLFVWTRSIWVPILVHFFNNGIAVFAAWMFARGNISTDASSFGETGQTFLIIASLVMVIALTALIWYSEAKKKGSTLD